MLDGLIDCIKNANHYIQRPVCFNEAFQSNLIIYEDDLNPSWRSFFIGLDLAIKDQRKRPLGVEGKTGTWAFRSIGVLYGEQHSFMHNFESFFWLLFWPFPFFTADPKRAASCHLPKFDKWNYANSEELAVSRDAVFHMKFRDFIWPSNDTSWLIWHSDLQRAGNQCILHPPRYVLSARSTYSVSPSKCAPPATEILVCNLSRCVFSIRAITFSI